MFKKVILVVLLAAAAQPSVTQTQQSSYAEMRKLLSSMGSVVLNSDSLAELFRTGDQHITDLIKLLNDPDSAISVRAQIVIRYLDNDAGMKALSEYYARPQEHLTAGPKRLPSSERDNILKGERDLAKLVQQNCPCVKSEDREYAHTRVLALSTCGDKALIEIYMSRGALMEEWYHVVIKKSGDGWKLVSVYQAAQS